MPGLPYGFTVTVTNPSGFPLTGVHLNVAQPAAFSTFTWTCAGAAFGPCSASTGAGPLALTVTIAGSGVNVGLGTISFATGTLTRTITVTVKGDTKYELNDNETIVLTLGEIGRAHV